MNRRTPDRELLRILRHLAKKGVSLERLDDDTWQFAGGVSRPAGCSRDIAAELERRGLVALRDNSRLVLSATGAALLRRRLADAEDFSAQHQERVAAIISDGDGAQGVMLNRAESPLAWLRSRHDRNGRPFIGVVEFTAGERLRADYSRGQIMPRVTANWTTTVADGRRGGVADITEVAMAARLRVEHALTSVGPDLGGLLVDFCCFLKGLEAIERERLWPARSAKVVLQVALAALARHYGLSETAKGPIRSGRLRQWGTPDYRPSIG